MRILRPLLPAALLALAANTLGCGFAHTDANISTPQTSQLHGAVHGGQQPVAGATIKVYHVNPSAEKGSSVSILSGTTTTDSNGNFNITAKYDCDHSTYVYMVASGGQPLPGTTNANLTMMTALGPCTALSDSTILSVNELTTVAAVAALAPYMASLTAIGTSSSPGETNNFGDRFALAAQFVNTASGQAPGTALPANMSSPQQLLNTLGDILAACINSAGGVAGDGSTCGNLFALTTVGTNVPTDTVTAMLNLLNHPTANTTSLFNLITADAPFAPALSAVPATYSVALIPPAFTVTRSLITLPDNGLSQIYTLINGAQSTLDMTMYELVDTTASADLVAACGRGVTVRVILDQSVQSTNLAAYNQINAAPANCSAAWSNSLFHTTHQKSIVVDNTELALSTANLTSQYYANGRDFILLTNDPIDIAAVEDTFAQDFGSTTSADRYYSNLPGNDLLWSPTSAQTGLLQVINNATQTVSVENEEMSATNIIAALSAAVQRGVTCNVIMTDGGSYDTQLTQLKTAGCNVRTYADRTNVLYIHAKVILSDYGTAAQVGYMGSINFSSISMLNNRELGTVLTDPAILSGLNTALTSDFNGGTAY